MKRRSCYYSAGAQQKLHTLGTGGREHSTAYKGRVHAAYRPVRLERLSSGRLDNTEAEAPINLERYLLHTTNHTESN